MTSIDSHTVRAGEYPQQLRVRTHELTADVGPISGGADSAPSPHDYLDAALASCKALTAMWYAKRHGIPLERVETHLESDDSQERAGIYRIRVAIAFHGPLTDDQRTALYRAIAACPIHKLLTTTDVQIETIEQRSSPAV
ncbi:MAG: OsmC family protein [Kofleriaceae bacterium]